jgi:hypothetical protein
VSPSPSSRAGVPHDPGSGRLPRCKDRFRVRPVRFRASPGRAQSRRPHPPRSPLGSGGRLRPQPHRCHIVVALTTSMSHRCCSGRGGWPARPAPRGSQVHCRLNGQLAAGRSVGGVGAFPSQGSGCHMRCRCAASVRGCRWIVRDERRATVGLNWPCAWMARASQLLDLAVILHQGAAAQPWEARAARPRPAASSLISLARPTGACVARAPFGPHRPAVPRSHTGRRAPWGADGVIEPSRRSSATSTSSRQVRIVRSSIRSRG